MDRYGSSRWARIFVVASIAALGLFVACSGGQKAAPDNPAPAAAEAPAPAEPAKADSGAISDEAMNEAVNIFSTRCLPCHGAEGAGDGPASKGLTPQPRNLQDPEWQKSVTDDHIEKIIKFGGSAVGKSPMMPPNPDLSSKDEVVKALRVHIRGLAKS